LELKRGINLHSLREGLPSRVVFDVNFENGIFTMLLINKESVFSHSLLKMSTLLDSSFREVSL
jgi:hypothetical protein